MDDDAYRRAGVDLDAGDRALQLIREAVTSTYTPQVLAGLGSFGGLYALDELPEAPVLVASTDGVGTKTMVAAALGRLGGIGRDLVHHCVNDILVLGARPLFFLDYAAAARLDPEAVAELVGGIADACRGAGMPLLGGETAELPGVYAEGEFDLVGTIVGVVGRAAIVDGSRVREGDTVLALASGGLQTNGFSLARAVLAESYSEPLGVGSRTVGDALLAEHRSFLPAVAPLLGHPGLHALAHVTGGGVEGNLPRVLPAGLGARLDPGSWVEPPVFDRIRTQGQIPEPEMRRVFNLGLGFLVVAASDAVEALQERCPEPLLRVGRIEDGSGVRWGSARR